MKKLVVLVAGVILLFTSATYGRGHVMNPGEAKLRLNRIVSSKGKMQITQTELNNLLAVVPKGDHKYYREKIRADKKEIKAEKDKPRDFEMPKGEMPDEHVDMGMDNNFENEGMMPNANDDNGFNNLDNKPNNNAMGNNFENEGKDKEELFNGLEEDNNNAGNMGNNLDNKKIDEFAGMPEMDVDEIGELKLYVGVLEPIFKGHDNLLNGSQLAEVASLPTTINNLELTGLMRMFPSLGKQVPKELADYFKYRFEAEKEKDGGILTTVKNPKKTAAMNNAYAAFKAFADEMFDVANNEMVKKECVLYKSLYHVLDTGFHYIKTHGYLKRAMDEESLKLQESLKAKHDLLLKKLSNMKHFAGKCK
jgi:hypothetical protein